MINKIKSYFESTVFNTRFRLIGSNGKVMNLNHTDYANMLSAAKKWGWCPCGVDSSIKDSANELPVDYGDADYFLNVGGTVIDSDAKGIADALVRMMHEKERKPNPFYFVSGLFDYEHEEPKNMKEFWGMCSEGTIEMVKTFSGFLVLCPLDMDWYLVSSRKAVLKKFIKFCRAGSFKLGDHEGC